MLRGPLCRLSCGASAGTSAERFRRLSDRSASGEGGFESSMDAALTGFESGVFTRRQPVRTTSADPREGRVTVTKCNEDLAHPTRYLRGRSDHGARNQRVRLWTPSYGPSELLWATATRPIVVVKRTAVATRKRVGSARVGMRGRRDAPESRCPTTWSRSRTRSRRTLPRQSTHRSRTLGRIDECELSNELGLSIA